MRSGCAETEGMFGKSTVQRGRRAEQGPWTVAEGEDESWRALGTVKGVSTSAQGHIP